MTHRRSPQADSDMDEIWLYIATQSHSYEAADRFIDSIVDRFLLLATHPHIGRARDEELRPGLRSFPVGDYMILYRIEDPHILILRVLHGRRNLRVLLG
ncbi:MAG TPA: type II toxin-antitoxin system RelE/ParE family toxin [Acidobacteriaceae bacterium]|nr:type II toxin-antitoxin system RelE/ParE family toxin [Acidobacteriaceae bacterium]